MWWPTFLISALGGRGSCISVSSRSACLSETIVSFRTVKAKERDSDKKKTNYFIYKYKKILVTSRAGKIIV